MAQASDYPITFPYKSTDPPYGTPALPYHRGEDRAMPAGTPVVVNGVTIGLSGDTGLSTGSHLHIGRFLGGKDTPPNGGGFQFNNAVVTEINQDNTDGKYVRVQADGASWVYLHLSDNSKVKVGQALQGANMDDKITNQGEADLLFAVALHKQDHEGAKGFIGMRWVDALTLIESGKGPGSHDEQDQKLALVSKYTPEQLADLINNKDSVKIEQIRAIVN